LRLGLSRIGHIYPYKKILAEKDKDITLLIPKAPMLKPIKSGKHYSEWREEEFTNLKRDAFTKEAQNLIEELVSKNKWIEEQTIKPVDLILNEINKK